MRANLQHEDEAEEKKKTAGKNAANAARKLKALGRLKETVKRLHEELQQMLKDLQELIEPVSYTHLTLPTN